MYVGRVFNLNCNEHGRVPVFFLNSNDAFHASVLVLVDTGATLSVVSLRWAKKCGFKILSAPTISLRTACGTCVSSDKAVSLSFTVGGKNFTFLFRVLSELHDDVLIGRDFLAQYNIGVRCGAGRTSHIVNTLSAEPTLGSLARCDVPRHEVPTPNCVLMWCKCCIGNSAQSKRVPSKQVGVTWQAHQCTVTGGWLCPCHRSCRT